MAGGRADLTELGQILPFATDHIEDTGLRPSATTMGSLGIDDEGDRTVVD